MNNNLKQAIGNQKIEGLNAPSTDDLNRIVKTYKNKLGEDVANSLILSLNENLRTMEEENKNEPKTKLK